MNYKNIGWGKPLAMAALLALSVRCAQASAAPAVSGTYQVVQSRLIGSQSRIQMRVHLVNHGASDVFIQRITLCDFSRAENSGTRAALALRAHASANTTVQFSVPRSDYQRWQQGFRPRLVLQMAGPGGLKSKAVVRLDRISGPEAK